MDIRIEPLKPGIGAKVNVDRAVLLDKNLSPRWLELLETHGVLIFPRVGLSDEEQLAFTDAMGARVNFTKSIAGGDKSAAGVYTVTLDPKINTEPEYVLGTFFWHLDGVCVDIPPPKASVLSCRRTAPKGGQTEFANTYAAYEALPQTEKAELDGLRVLHSVEAGVREVAGPDALEPTKRGSKHEQPLIWTHKSGRKSLMIGYTADYVIGMSKAESRALLARLLEWSAQPDFSYRHYWQEGDLAIWDNCGVLHRVIPYASNSGRTMHRTSVAGVEMAR